MTPTETSATTTTLPPGRDLDVAVARALGLGRTHAVVWEPCSRDGLWNCPACGASYCSPPWTKNKVEQEFCQDYKLPPFSTDDATALRHVVPWLRKRGYDIDVHFYGDARREWVEVHAFKPHTTLENADAAMDGPNALAAALCQVIVAVSKESGNG